VPERPLIAYIPGLKPKPEPDRHKAQLFRCLKEGIRRVDADLADELDPGDDFRLVSWTYDFYGEYRDIRLDLDDIERLLSRDGPSESDLEVATSLRRRFATWLFRTADFLPFLVPSVATGEVQVHLRDFHHYLRNPDGISDAARSKLKSVVHEAKGAGRPLLMIGHSMGSVIAYDALWQLTHQETTRAGVDLLLTTGSPLGQRIVQRHLFGWKRSGRERYPGNIGRWVNVAAVGELTAIDRVLRNDFGEMLSLGLVSDIDDRDAFNWYRMDGALNVHVEYGYLVNEVIARTVSEWWRQMTGLP